MKLGRIKYFKVTFFFKSFISIPPTLSDSIGTTLKPAMTALAGLVPCAVLGITHIYDNNFNKTQLIGTCAVLGITHIYKTIITTKLN